MESNATDTATNATGTAMNAKYTAFSLALGKGKREGAEVRTDDAVTTRSGGSGWREKRKNGGGGTLIATAPERRWFWAQGKGDETFLFSLHPLATAGRFSPIRAEP